jgi:pimeloyl-ACP methyl ester carboxylesterase
MTVTTVRETDATAIRPFTIEFPEADLEDLRARIAATRWPDKETVGDHSQGVRLATIQELARYWLTEHDWRRCEATLNALPNFVTEIDGLDIHFIHVRSPHEDALPLVVGHGWPGSVVEQLKIIEPLTNPTAHGGSASDAFHLVIPSMPGYGFSGKPTTTGWGPARIASAYVELMKRLGYTRFAAQGGDWGAFVVEQMAVQAPPELVGIHTNFAQVVPPAVDRALQTGAPAPSGLSAEERRAYEQVAFTFQHLVEQLLMASRPQTLYGLADSPVGLAAFFLDHDVTSQEGIARAFLEQTSLGDLSRDDVLDNITLFWLTNTAISAARLSWEAAAAGISFFGVKGVSLPVAVSVFPDELYQPPRSWAEQAYPNLVHFNELPMGGHFAAWGEPKAFAEELRAGLRSLRT